jgi:membrane fusion protein, heavy metal efflux system
LTTRTLARLKTLFSTRAISQKDLEQAVSDQQTAEGALRAARDAIRIFGKTDAEIDLIVKDRRADPTLVVPSPISGRITARNAAPGLLVQPGNPPAPYVVADLSTMWMLANVAESDVPAFAVGQEVKVSVSAFLLQDTSPLSIQRSMSTPVGSRCARKSPIPNMSCAPVCSLPS